MLKSKSFNWKVRALQIINHIGVVGAILYLFTHHEWMWLSASLFAFLLYGILGANIGLHRLFAHRSFATSRPWEYVLGFFGVLSTLGSTIGWSGVHRFHHGHPDKEEDPHSPLTIGNFNAWVGFWKGSPISPGIVSDLIHDPLHKFLHRHYFNILFVFALMLFFIHPVAPLFIYCIPATLCLHGSSAISVLCHRSGYRNHETSDNSHNNWVAWIMSLGEGWHNNHHAKSSSYRQGERPWELDPSAWLIENVFMKKPEKLRSAVPNINPAKIQASLHSNGNLPDPHRS